MSVYDAEYMSQSEAEAYALGKKNGYKVGYLRGKEDAASPWHRVEEPPKDAYDCLVCWTTIHDEETGEVTGHGFWCEKGWYEDGLLGEVGFYCQRREETHPVRVEPDYWMPIEPPKEDA